MYKNKLISLLKEVPEIKEDLEDLIFWTEVELVWYFWEKKINHLVDINCLEFFVCWIQERFYKHNIKKIIWNEIEERHLRIYCDKDELCIEFFGKTIKISWMPSCSGQCIDDWFFTLDNSKSFWNQSEEFYEKIYNYLINLK